jgi:hypothetical protein
MRGLVLSIEKMEVFFMSMSFVHYPSVDPRSYFQATGVAFLIKRDLMTKRNCFRVKILFTDLWVSKDYLVER